MSGIETKQADPHAVLLSGVLKDQITAPQLIPNQLATDAFSISLGRLSGEIMLGTARIEIVDPDNNLRTAQEHLEVGSLVPTLTHCEGDMATWARFMKENFPLTRTNVLVARKYLDPSRGFLSKTLFIAFSAWRKAYGGSVIPLVQNKEEERKRYPDADMFNFGSIRKVLKLLKEAGNILAIMSEGTRALGKEIGKAEKGTEVILERGGDNTLFLPVSIIPTHIRPYGQPTRIFVGRPYSRADIMREHEAHPKIPIRHLMMAKNAALLPKENRNPYYRKLLQMYPELGQAQRVAA